MQKQTLYLNCNYGPKGPKREVENDTFEEREQKHTHNTVPIYLSSSRDPDLVASYPHHLSSTGRETTVVLLTREHFHYYVALWTLKKTILKMASNVVHTFLKTYNNGVENLFLKFALGAGKQTMREK